MQAIKSSTYKKWKSLMLKTLRKEGFKFKKINFGFDQREPNKKNGLLLLRLADPLDDSKESLRAVERLFAARCIGFAETNKHNLDVWLDTPPGWYPPGWGTHSKTTGI